MAVSRLSQQSLQNAFPKGNTIWDGTTSTSAFDSLGSVLLSSAATTVTFSNIPATYTHLQLRFLAQTNRATIGRDSVKAYFNADTTAFYTSHGLQGDGTSTAAYSNGVSGTYMELGYVSSSAASGFFGLCVIDILDYANPNKNTVCRSMSGANLNGSVGGYGGNVGVNSGVWLKTTAVSSITLTPFVGTTFSAYSQFSLYGVK